MKKSDEYETRIKALEARKPEPEKRVQAPVIPAQVFLQQIENFTPKKPATLRPNQVRGRDIQGVENVIEFDVKIKGKIADAKKKHNEFLKELGLPPLPWFIVN